MELCFSQGSLVVSHDIQFDFLRQKGKKGSQGLLGPYSASGTKTESEHPQKHEEQGDLRDQRRYPPNGGIPGASLSLTITSRPWDGGRKSPGWDRAGSGACTFILRWSEARFFMTGFLRWQSTFRKSAPQKKKHGERLLKERNTITGHPRKGHHYWAPQNLDRHRCLMTRWDWVHTHTQGQVTLN